MDLEGCGTGAVYFDPIGEAVTGDDHNSSYTVSMQTAVRGVRRRMPAADWARGRAALEHGDTVVVASEPRVRGDEPFADWWKVSGDGTALGMGYRGWGSEFVERDAVAQPSIKTLELQKDAIRVEKQLAEFKKAYQAWIKRGGDPHAHLRDHPALVNPFDDTQPIIAALADTLPYITAL